MAALTITIALAIIFAFLNGVHDASNVVSTMISSRSLSPTKALIMTAVAEFIGPFMFGVAVAKTIGQGLVAQEAVTLPVIMAALVGAIVWNIITWVFGIPSSSSHALVGGILGAVVVGGGWSHVIPSGLATVLIALFASPLVGMIVGFIFTRLIYFLSRGASLRINWFFKNAQLLTGLGLALSQGTNDAQKAMGVIALGLVASGMLPSFEVPLWVVALSAGALAAGTATGGWGMIRTLGGKFYKIRPVNGFSAQLASASVLLAAALLGGPVSSTQVVSSTIAGVGAAERMSKVRWGVMGNIAVAWLLTIPATGAVAALAYLLLNMVF
ncbi:MAG: inorganic phosphate transporter [Anaerolineaceae bacterium]|jgi:PiT family inorganic phosphate transporter|nr:inorganic phosphate transporter [Anaerolineaceae bacterium]